MTSIRTPTDTQKTRLDTKNSMFGLSGSAPIKCGSCHTSARVAVRFQQNPNPYQIKKSTCKRIKGSLRPPTQPEVPSIQRHVKCPSLEGTKNMLVSQHDPLKKLEFTNSTILGCNVPGNLWISSQTNGFPQSFPSSPQTEPLGPRARKLGQAGRPAPRALAPAWIRRRIFDHREKAIGNPRKVSTSYPMQVNNQPY